MCKQPILVANGLTSSKRCAWVSEDPLYIAYHDQEWGRPQYSSQKLFEKLCLEGQLAGLSWITVLKKRAEYRRCFFDFDAGKIVTLDETALQRLLQNAGLIRNRLKLHAIISNAQAYLMMQQRHEDFSQFIWSFVDGRQQLHRFQHPSEIPTTSEQAKAMSKALKQRGFKFVGETICYAFMQSMGLVNDHLLDCCCYQACCQSPNQ